MEPSGSSGENVRIKYVSFHEKSGYGIAGRRYLLGLAGTGLTVTWTPMVKGRRWGLGYEPFEDRKVGDPALDPLCNRAEKYNTVIVHTVPEYFPLWRAREPGKRIIGCTVWETDRLPAHWPALLNSIDGIMVPCEWNAEVFRKCGVKPRIDVVPHVADPTFDGLGRERNSAEEFVFYTIGTWTTRKALWNTIECFLETFNADDAVRLVVKTTPEDFTRPRWLRGFHRVEDSISRIMSGRRNPARITIITDELSDADVVALHRNGDCYISLCRSEGWGLGAFDAATAGRPVIMPAFGGHLDYLPSELAFLLPCEPLSVRTSPPSRSYTHDQSWAEPSRAHARDAMRWIVAHQREAWERGRGLAEYIRRNFGSEAVMPRMLRALYAAEAVAP